MLRRFGVRAFSFLFALVLVVFARTAAAHAIGVSKGEYVVLGNRVTVNTTFARGEITPLVPSLDPDKTGTLEQDFVTRSRAALERVVLGQIVVRGDGQLCPTVLDLATLTEPDGITISGHAECPVPITKLGLEVNLLADLSPAHRHIAHVVLGAITLDEVCYRGHSNIEGTVAAESGDAGEPQDEHRRVTDLELLKMGFLHILDGRDHLLFLVGLVLVGGRMRSLALVITAFTLAHSITLALATLNVWAPSPRFVEPMIAASIAYVGLENFFITSASRRWRITFPFGLIHGFGFAGALREIDLPRAQIPTALVMFNAGVEIGQLLVLALVLPLIFLLRKNDLFARYGVKVLSGLIVVAGLVWFVQRIWYPA